VLRLAGGAKIVVDHIASLKTVSQADGIVVVVIYLRQKNQTGYQHCRNNVIRSSEKL
jgi:hypothetical protein